MNTNSIPGYKLAGLILGVLLAVVIILGPDVGAEIALERGLPPYAPKLALALLVWTFTWWIASPVPLAVTALLPGLFSSVLTGITPGALGYKDTSTAIRDIWRSYADPVIILFLGGFLLTGILSESGLTRRIAYVLVTSRLGRVNLYFTALMLWTACWFLSWWISNTAATAILYPIALVLVTRIPNLSRRYQEFLLLGLAYAATAGGLATPIGTPPNLIAIKQASDIAGISLSFTSFMILGIPTAIITLLLGYFILLAYFKPEKEMRGEIIQLLEEERRKISRITREELFALGVFVFTITLWILRSLPDIFSSAGFAELYENTKILKQVIPDDAVPPLLAIVIAFTMPSFVKIKPFNWEKIREWIEWDVLLIFGGGLVLGSVMLRTGFGEYITRSIAQMFGEITPFTLLLVAGLVAFVLTQFSSNTAVAAMTCPLVTQLGKGLFGEIVGAQASIISGIMASIAFTLPISTPPNAIVFASGRIQLKNMIICGLIRGTLTLISSLLIWLHGLPLILK